MISLLAGNSRILLTVDEHGGWAQLYYPYPGLHQQLHAARLGLFDEDSTAFTWVDQGGESPVEVRYLEDSNAARTRLRRLGMDVTLDDMVHPDLDVVIRRVTLHNPGDADRRLRLFHYQSLNIGGSQYQDTTYYDERRNTIVQYKRSYYFQAWGHPAFDDHTCGEHTLKGLRGSYVQAERGRLTRNPISHGATDSVVQWDLHVPPGEERVVHLFVMVSRSRAGVDDLLDRIDGRDPSLFTDETVGYWNHWVDNKRPVPAGDLSPRAHAVYRRSLFLMNDCTSRNGAIIASPDYRTLKYGGDSYNYCWWRDGGYISRAMSEAGLHDGARAFLRFAAECQEEDGSYLHRHFPDGYLGTTWHLPSFLQIDQTASVIDAVHHHYQCTGNLDVLLEQWDMVRRAADFLMDFVDDRGLPQSSFDLWEERKAVNAYSVSMVVRGLRAAARIGNALSKRSDFWLHAADRMQRAGVDEFWDPGRGMLRKSIDPLDETVDASALLTDLFEPDDPRYRQVVDAVERRLWVSAWGGIARYEGDHYYGNENPWIICTLWLAQARLRLGDHGRCRELIEWAAGQAGRGDLLPEQLDARTGERTSVTPLVWSHSTFVETVHAYTRHVSRPGAGAGGEPVAHEVHR